MLRVQRTSNGEVVFAVSGRLTADSLRELTALLAHEPAGQPVALELGDLLLVDRGVVQFLKLCEGKGILLRNCPAYIRTWMACEGKVS
jgi:hypothetical protein